MVLKLVELIEGEFSMKDIRIIRANNTKKLMIIGLMARGLDGINQDKTITESQVKKVPFSKNYIDYDSYKSDLDMVLMYINKDEDIPDNLIKKIYETKKELGILDD